MRYYISHETGSVYWLTEPFSNDAQPVLMYAPINADNTFDNMQDGSEVDEDLVGSEFVDFRGERKLKDVYAEVRKALA